MYVNIFIYSNKLLLLFVWSSTLKKEKKKKALNNIHFLPVFGKSLRNNVLPTKLSSSLPVFPPISLTLFFLVRHPHQHITHLTHADIATTSQSLPFHQRQHVNHVTQVSTSPTQAHHPCPTQACHPNHPCQHAISSTPRQHATQENKENGSQKKVSLQ